MIKFMVAIAVLLAGAGCGPKPYSYNAEKSDPVLVFTSDYEMGTSFYVNIDPSNKLSDYKFMLAGDIPHTLEAPKREFTIQVPADQVVTLRARHFHDKGEVVEICGGPPSYPDLFFTPKKGHTYKIKMNADIDETFKTKPRICYLNITDAADPESTEIRSNSIFVHSISISDDLTVNTAFFLADILLRVLSIALSK